MAVGIILLIMGIDARVNDEERLHAKEYFDNLVEEP